MADSVEKLFAIGATVEIASPNTASNDKCGFFGGIKNLQRLTQTSKPGTSLKTLLRLSKDLRVLGDSQLSECLNLVYQSHSALVGPLLTALAVAGRGNIQKTVFQFMDSKEVEDQARQGYYLMLAHNLWPGKTAKITLVWKFLHFFCIFELILGFL